MAEFKNTLSRLMPLFPQVGMEGVFVSEFLFLCSNEAKEVGYSRRFRWIRLPLLRMMILVKGGSDFTGGNLWKAWKVDKCGKQEKVIQHEKCYPIGDRIPRKPSLKVLSIYINWPQSGRTKCSVFDQDKRCGRQSSNRNSDYRVAR